MAEYIERKKAFKLIKEQKEKETGAYSKGRNTGLFIAGSIINNKEVLPSADVEEVVRCKKCKYHREWVKGDHQCTRGVPFSITVDSYCSYGERRTENDL